MMQLSTHYYVLSLDERKSRLYEGFRDSLIDIQNTQFPFEITSPPNSFPGSSTEVSALREFMIETDHHFAHYLAQDPLWVVLVGCREYLSLFKEVTAQGTVFIGELEGDYTAVSPKHLGTLAWLIVTKVLAGSLDHSLRELEQAASTNDIIVGFDAVSQSVYSETVSSLFVDDNYHMKGSIRVTDKGAVLIPEVDVEEVIDDAVDALVERVLAKGGDVVFLSSDMMRKFQRIALIGRN